jgi:hypothetical protein
MRVNMGSMSCHNHIGNKAFWVLLVRSGSLIWSDQVYNGLVRLLLPLRVHCGACLRITALPLCRFLNLLLL